MDEPIAPTAQDNPGIRDPEELEASGTPASGEISPLTTLGSVHLTITDLRRSLDYYQDAVGLKLLDRGDGHASLGVGERELLVLVERPDAQSSVGCTGLYHFALLVPERIDLAGWLAHAATDRVPLVGLSDHFVSEALYLSDPDGHGIEIYWDRPRETWEGEVAERMTTLPLDVESLIGELPDDRPAPFDGLPEGTTMGHIHLKVASIPETVVFFRDLLGFGLMASLGSAAFLSAGGYHHHLGANTWESAGAPAPPEGSVALRHATVVLPDDRELERLLGRVRSAGREVRESSGGPLIRDPSGNALVLTSAAVSTG